jgi:hypothetical protein
MLSSSNDSPRHNYSSSPSSQAASDTRPVSISGAEGPYSMMINGVFLLTAESCNGKPKYRMEGNLDKCLVYSSSAIWSVSNAVGNEANGGFLNCFSENSSIAHPTLVKAWVVWTGSEFHLQPGVSATALVGNLVRNSL